jgi:hypothetical protein
MTGTTRDRLAIRVAEVMAEVAAAVDDGDLTNAAARDCQRLWANLSAALDGFNRPVGDGPWSDGGPTGADLAGEVRHDIG